MKPVDHIKVAEAIWTRMRIELGPEFSELSFEDLMLHSHFVHHGRVVTEGRLVAIRRSLLEASKAAIDVMGRV